MTLQISHDNLIKFINNSHNNVSFTKDNVLIYKREFKDIRDKIVITNIIENINMISIKNIYFC